MKIKVKGITAGCLPFIIEKGDWIDLRAAETVSFKAPQAGVRKRETIDGEIVSHRDVTFDFKLIKLGVAMQLPKGFEAVVLPRSSTPKLGIMCANSEGVIDNSYCGRNDEWCFPAYAVEDTVITRGDRIAQFRIVRNQPEIELVEVEDLTDNDRNGFGSSGVR